MIARLSARKRPLSNILASRISKINLAFDKFVAQLVSCMGSVAYLTKTSPSKGERSCLYPRKGTATMLRRNDSSNYSNDRQMFHID